MSFGFCQTLKLRQLYLTLPYWNVKMSHTKLTLHYQGIENNLFGDLDLIEANWTFLQTSMTSGVCSMVCMCVLCASWISEECLWECLWRVDYKAYGTSFFAAVRPLKVDFIFNDAVCLDVLERSILFSHRSAGTLYLHWTSCIFQAVTIERSQGPLPLVSSSLISEQVKI